MSCNAYFTLIGTRLLYKTRKNAYWRDMITGKMVFIQQANGTPMYRDEGTDVWHPIEKPSNICHTADPVTATCGAGGTANGR